MQFQTLLIRTEVHINQEILVGIFTREAKQRKKNLPSLFRTERLTVSYGENIKLINLKHQQKPTVLTASACFSFSAALGLRMRTSPSLQLD